MLLVGGGQTNGFVQTIEIYCGNSAAVSGQNTKRADIIAMANAAKASGHRLMLVSTSKQPVDSGKVPLGMTLPDMIYNAVFDTEALSLTHRPNTDFKVALPIYIGPAPLS